MNRIFQGRGLLLATAALVLIVDQYTKALVVRNLAVNEAWAPIPALARFFTISHVTNTGAAFGLFPDRGMLFVLIAVVVIIAIAGYYRFLPTALILVRVSLGLQLGGALGNLFDRLHYGYVVDFIDFKFWPVFNVADASIVVGVLILAFYLLREEEGKHSRPDGTEAGPPADARPQPISPDPADPASGR